jgi:hypothetical protein
MTGGSLTERGGGGGGTSAWGARGGARRRAVHGRGGTRRGGAGARRGDVWRRDGGDVAVASAPRPLFQTLRFEGREFDLFDSAFAGWRRPPPPPLCLQRCLGQTRPSP